MQANLNEIIPLLCVDQATRWESGDYVLVEDYYEQYPDLIEDQELLLDLIYNEIYLRDEHKRSSDSTTFKNRFLLVLVNFTVFKYYNGLAYSLQCP